MTSALCELWAAMELGKITKNKLRSFSGYFEPFLKYTEPWYPDEEIKEKVLKEAKGIHAWLNNTAQWPDESKRSSEFLIEAAMLYYYFYHADLEASLDKATRLADEAVQKTPQDFQLQVKKARIFNEAGPDLAIEAAQAAEKALSLNPEEAKKSHILYEAATARYHAGFFKAAYEHLIEQSKVDPEYANTKDLLFVFESRIKNWEQIPERVTFQADESGNKVPVPVLD